jgi:membrane associated rhomboid family serine protease
VAGPDLFVVCKSCGSEVSPYITECPYCGTRLRKRAPKIERDGSIAEPKPSRRVKTRRAPRAPRVVRTDRWGKRPHATIVLVALSCFMWVTLAFVGRGDLVILSGLADQPERLLSSVFVYPNGWYQMVALVAIGLYGWLLERRHGPVPVVGLFVLGGIGGIAAAAALDDLPAYGANGAALALLCAWAMRDALAARRGEDYEGDLLGTAVISAVVFLMPLAVDGASWIAAGVGILVGAVAGALLARAPES